MISRYIYIFSLEPYTWDSRPRLLLCDPQWRNLTVNTPSCHTPLFPPVKKNLTFKIPRGGEPGPLQV